MLRVVIDTNTLISAALSRKEGCVRDALTHAYKYHDIYQSNETLAELRDVLMRPKFDKYLSQKDREEFIDEVAYLSEIVVPEPVTGVSPDPKDDKFFALAKAVKAHYIISGDVRDVLSVPVYEGTRTVSPANFVFASEKVLDITRPEKQESTKSTNGLIIVPDILQHA